MDATEAVPVELTEDERVHNWRLLQLLRSGYTQADADAIALRIDIDLHRATELITRGCPASIAVEILL